MWAERHVSSPVAQTNPTFWSSCQCQIKLVSLKFPFHNKLLYWWALSCVISPDISASEPIAEMLLNAEESWLQRLKDPSAPLPSTDQRYDGGSHDLNTPVKNLWVNSFMGTVVNLRSFHRLLTLLFPPHLSLILCPKSASFPSIFCLCQEPPGSLYL